MKDNFERRLKVLRSEIDRLDSILIKTLARRMKVSESMGELKGRYKKEILQKARWSVVVSTRLAKARAQGLDPKFTNQIFKEIHKLSLAIQKKVKRR